MTQVTPQADFEELANPDYPLLAAATDYQSLLAAIDDVFTNLLDQAEEQAFLDALTKRIGDFPDMDAEHKIELFSAVEGKASELVSDQALEKANAIIDANPSALQLQIASFAKRDYTRG